MKPIANTWTYCVALMIALVILFISLSGCKMRTNDEKPDNFLPLFNPHRTNFDCVMEMANVDILDAEADSWFQQSVELEDPSIYEGDRDYSTIVRLTRRAAERGHWKAALNLASLYLEGKDPPHGEADAVNIVRGLMARGVPAAYDRLGTYYLNGIGGSGASEAYALFQRAAEMGNPQAMVYLGAKLNAVWDNPREGFWANIPIAIKMLECAMGQGEGNAAATLYFIYQRQNRPDAKSRAMRVLHEGVKLGCARCANILSIDFADPIVPTDMFVPSLDQARADRYKVFLRALEFNPRRRYPNLDRVLPLPPAPLPPWNGDRDTLLDAAKGITLPPKVPKSTEASLRTGKHFLSAEFELAGTGVTSDELVVPQSAYWKVISNHSSRAISPACLTAGDCFPEPIMRATAIGSKVVWEKLRTIHHNYNDVAPRAKGNITRSVPSQGPLQSCEGKRASCPTTGVWQPWVPHDHPLSSIVNEPWRQAWLMAGQGFPHPLNDWLLDLPPQQLTWHLLDDTELRIG